MTEGTLYPVPAGRVLVTCTVAGVITFALADGTTVPVTMAVGSSYHPLRATKWAGDGTVAATVYGLR